MSRTKVTTTTELMGELMNLNGSYNSDDAEILMTEFSDSFSIFDLFSISTSTASDLDEMRGALGIDSDSEILFKKNDDGIFEMFEYKDGKTGDKIPSENLLSGGFTGVYRAMNGNTVDNDLATAEGGQEEPTASDYNLMDVPDSPDSDEFKDKKKKPTTLGDNLIETDPPDSAEFKEKKFDIHDIATNVLSHIKSGVDTIKSYNNLSNQEEATFNVDAYESFKKLNIKVDLTDVKELRNKVIDAADYFNENIVTGIDNIITSLEELNPKTKEKLQKIDLEILKLSLSKTYRNNITEGFNYLIAKLTQNLKDNDAIDTNSSGEAETNNPGVIPTNPGGGGGGGGGSTKPKPIDDITPEIPVNQDNLNKLTPAIAGMIVFTEVVSLYTSIGSENPIQSSLTGNYGLLGLVHQNDKYYYKIMDKDTGQVYFVEMNDKAKITWDDKGERQAIEIVGDNAFVMKLPQEGDVLVRTADIGDVYFLNGDKMTFDGIDYYNITDSITGETAYIPVSESLAGPTLVSNLGNTSSSNNSSEVIE